MNTLTGLGRLRRAAPWLALAALALTAACGDAMDAAGAKSTSTEAQAPGPAYGTDTSSAKDTSSTGQGAADAAVGQGPTNGGGFAGDDDGGIGLKPGGPQDIGFFRLKVAKGELPKPGDMTIEGWLNEHDTKLPKADPSRTVDLHALAGIFQAKGVAEPDVVLQLGLNSAKSLANVTAKVALTLVIDRSGSMSGDKLAYVKEGLQALLEPLPAGTRLGIVSFSSDVKTDWAPVDYDPAQKQQIVNAIVALQANGGTNIHGGLQLGLSHCAAAGDAYTFRRVLLLSDGQATEGNTSTQDIVALAAEGAKSGCSVSSVGVGYDFDPNLMNQVAQQGDGTAWFLQNAAHAKQVFVQDLETMLLPVAEKLWIQLQLAPGWTVAEIHGFDWVQKGDLVQLLGPKKDTAGAQPAPGDPDAGTTEPQEDPQEPAVALPTLFASKKNGFIMARLQAPAGTDLATVQDLLLAKVSYGYALAKTGVEEKFEVPVQVPGLAAVPDGGLEYFGSPIVRRAFALLQVGRALMQACVMADAGQPESAAAVLAAAVALAQDQKAALTADELASYDPAPGFDDAVTLAETVAGLVGKPAAP